MPSVSQKSLILPWEKETQLPQHLYPLDCQEKAPWKYNGVICKMLNPRQTKLKYY